MSVYATLEQRVGEHDDALHDMTQGSAALFNLWWQLRENMFDLESRLARADDPTCLYHHLEDDEVFEEIEYIEGRLIDIEAELITRDIAPFGPSWPHVCACGTACYTWRATCSASEKEKTFIKKAFDDLTDFVNATPDDSLLGELAAAIRIVLNEADEIKYDREYVAALEGRIEQLEQALDDAETVLRESQPWGGLSVLHPAVPDWGRRVLDAFDSGFDAAIYGGGTP